MSGIEVTVETDLSGIERMLGDEAVRSAQALLVQTVLDDCTRYVPVRKGYLQGNTETTEDSITWTEEYAHYVYNLDHVISANNPGGQPQWFEHAKRLHLRDWVQVAGAALTEGR